jgi:hypothetical protein
MAQPMTWCESSSNFILRALRGEISLMLLNDPNKLNYDELVVKMHLSIK